MLLWTSLKEVVYPSKPGHKGQSSKGRWADPYLKKMAPLSGILEQPEAGQAHGKVTHRPTI